VVSTIALENLKSFSCIEHMEVQKYPHILVLVFRNKGHICQCFWLLFSSACLSPPPHPTFFFPHNTAPPPPHSTPLATTPHNDNDKDNKRKFERIDIFEGVQRARERMGRARMGNLEAQTVCEALGLDAQNLSADEEDKEGKGHKEDAQSQDMEMDQKDNAAEYRIIENKLHQSKLSRFFASSSSSSKCT
jgi:hypothetical protein